MKDGKKKLAEGSQSLEVQAQSEAMPIPSDAGLLSHVLLTAPGRLARQSGPWMLWSLVLVLGAVLPYATLGSFGGWIFYAQVGILAGSWILLTGMAAAELEGRQASLAEILARIGRDPGGWGAVALALIASIFLGRYGVYHALAALKGVGMGELYKSNGLWALRSALHFLLSNSLVFLPFAYLERGRFGPALSHAVSTYMRGLLGHIPLLGAIWIGPWATWILLSGTFPLTGVALTSGLVDCLGMGLFGLSVLVRYDALQGRFLDSSQPRSWEDRRQLEESSKGPSPSEA